MKRGRKEERGEEEEPLKMPSAECVVYLMAAGLSLNIKDLQSELWGQRVTLGSRRWLWWEGY